MLNVLSSLKQPAGMHVDEKRGCAWIVLAGGALGRVSLGGGALAIAQSTRIRAADITGNGSTLVLAARNGGLWTVDPDDPRSAAKRAGNVRAAPLQVAASRRPRPVVLTVARTARDTRLTSTDLGSGDQDKLPVRVRAACWSSVARPRRPQRPRHGRWYIARLRAGRPGQCHWTCPGQRIGSARAPAGLPSSSARAAVDPATGTVTTGSIDRPARSSPPRAWRTAHRRAHVRGPRSGGQSPTPPRNPTSCAQAALRRLLTPVWFSLAGTGLGPDDVRLEVPDGPDAGPSPTPALTPAATSRCSSPAVRWVISAGPCRGRHRQPWRRPPSR
jgi:hypothetical protein